MNNQDLSTLLAELDAALECAVFHASDQASADAAVKARNLWPQLREALRSLHEDALTGVLTWAAAEVREHALRAQVDQLTHERDEALAEGLEQARLLGASGSREARLRTLLAQRTEALREYLEVHLPVCFGCCAICKKARAVLAAEVPRG